MDLLAALEEVQAQIDQRRRHSNGREDATLSYRIQEFRATRPDVTTVDITSTEHTVGIPWLEFYLKRLMARQHRMMHLHEWARRCETALE